MTTVNVTDVQLLSGKSTRFELGTECGEWLCGSGQKPSHSVCLGRGEGGNDS